MKECLKTVFFPGKFHPPHLGQIQTILNIMSKYQKVIVGVSEHKPEGGQIMTPQEIITSLKDLFKHFDGVDVCLIKGVLVEKTDLSGLPQFDLLLSGNPDVLSWAEKLNLNAEYVPRSYGAGCSGTNVRRVLNYSTAETFWRSRTEYPNYPNTKQRRLIDANFIVKEVSDCKSVFDAGCGDGSILISLREFTNIDTFYGYDISSALLDNLLNRWGSCCSLTTKIVNLSDFKDFPQTDVTLSLGMFPYIFNDEDLETLILNFKSNLLIVRAPCSVGSEREVINKFSEDLGAHYSAVYRTELEYRNILAKNFEVCGVERAYPDAIESKFGTKHFFFMCRR